MRIPAGFVPEHLFVASPVFHMCDEHEGPISPPSSYKVPPFLIRRLSETHLNFWRFGDQGEQGSGGFSSSADTTGCWKK